jgi:hypothetical protein
MTSRFRRLAALSAMMVFAATVSPGLAGPRDDVRAGSGRCDGIADDRAWLDCYYGAAQPMRARLGLPPAPNSQQALVPPPGAPAARNPSPAPLQLNNVNPSGQPGFFGRLFTHTIVKPEPPSRMTAYTFDRAGFFTVILANGEVWRQSSVDAVQAKWRNPPGSYVVTILPGSKMDVGGHETYQVERVR